LRKHYRNTYKSKHYYINSYSYRPSRHLVIEDKKFNSRQSWLSITFNCTCLLHCNTIQWFWYDTVTQNTMTSILIAVRCSKLAPVLLVYNVVLCARFCHLWNDNKWYNN